jgi:pimeloyl-ACP methyl ester carboxylesterase
MTTTVVPIAGGIPLRVEVEGEGPALVFLHAGVSERHMWDPQWTFFRPRYRRVRWDWRGFGDTPHVAGPFSYADDVIRVLDALDIERATLVGCSFGGAVALQVAVQHPDRVERLALSGSGVPGFVSTVADPPAVQDLLRRAEEAWSNGDAPAALALEEQIWLIGPGRRREDVDAVYLHRAHSLLLRADRPDEGAVHVDADWSSLDLLPTLVLPILAIVGDQDLPGLIDSARYLAASCPGARFELLKGAAHLPSLEIPDTFNHMLDAWLEETAR